MRRNLLASFLLVSIAACGGGSAAPMPDGPLTAGVVAGNNQVVTAKPVTPLPQQAGIKIVRLPNGQVAAVHVMDRIGDLVLPTKAFAQTAVQGVPGQVACKALALQGDLELLVKVPCATSDATGVAWLTPVSDSVAGHAIMRVGVSTQAGVVITDSVSATVLAAAASPTYLAAQTPYMTFPAILPAKEVLDQYGNAVPYRIVSDGRMVVQDTTTGSVGARTIVSGPDAQADFTVELRGAAGVVVGKARYRINQGQLLWFNAGGVATNP